MCVYKGYEYFQDSGDWLVRFMGEIIGFFNSPEQCLDFIDSETGG